LILRMVVRFHQGEHSKVRDFITWYNEIEIIKVEFELLNKIRILLLKE